MFDPGSRYAALETATLTDGDRPIAYKRRRFLPRGADLPLLTDTTVADGERLDLVAARTLGDPEQFWRVCDANDAMKPADLERSGRNLRIPVPQP
jgi:hypothetical protein